MGAPPEVFLPILPSDGWRVLPADLQVYPPIWRAGGRLANTLPTSELIRDPTPRFVPTKFDRDRRRNAPVRPVTGSAGRSH